MFPNTSQTLAEYGDGVFAKSAMVGNGSANATITHTGTGPNIAAITTGASLSIALLIASGLLVWHWMRARNLACELREARALTSALDVANSGVVDQRHRVHEKAAFVDSTGGSELSNETAIVELPFHRETQELQG